MRADELDRLDALAADVAATGRTRLVVVARSHVSRVEKILTRHDEGAAWTTLQGCTVLHDDVAAVFARRAHGSHLTVPDGVALQPVDPGEVADRVVRLLRADPAGRVPDFGGPSVRLVDDLACTWLRWRDDDEEPPTGRCRVEVVDPEVDGTAERWPGAWLTPRRTAGTVEFEAWLAAQRGSAAESGQRRDEAVGTDAAGCAGRRRQQV
jgi:hypothetical protein